MFGLFVRGFDMSEKSVEEIVKRTSDFVSYVHEFYGPDGIYPMGVTIADICDATKVLLARHGVGVEFDSLDRERVRDIMIEATHREACGGSHEN